MMMKKKKPPLLLLASMVVGCLGSVAMAAPSLTVQPVEVVYNTSDTPGLNIYRLWVTVPSAWTGTIQGVMMSAPQYQYVMPPNAPYVFPSGIKLLTKGDNTPVAGTFQITYKAQQSHSVVRGTYTINLNQGVFTPYQNIKVSSDGVLTCEFQVTNDPSLGTPSRPEIIITCGNNWGA